MTSRPRLTSIDLSRIILISPPLHTVYTLGCRPNPLGDFIPKPLLRFAPMVRRYACIASIGKTHAVQSSLHAFSFRFQSSIRAPSARRIRLQDAAALRTRQVRHQRALRPNDAIRSKAKRIGRRPCLLRPNDALGSKAKRIGRGHCPLSPLRQPEQRCPAGSTSAHTGTARTAAPWTPDSWQSCAPSAARTGPSAGADRRSASGCSRPS